MVEKTVDLLSLPDYDFGQLNLFGVEEASLIFQKTNKTNVVFAYLWGRMSQNELKQICEYISEQMSQPISVIYQCNLSEKAFLNAKIELALDNVIRRKYIIRYLTVLNRLAFDTKKIVDLGLENASEISLLLNVTDNNTLVSAVAKVGQDVDNVSSLIVGVADNDSAYRDLFELLHADILEIASRRKNPKQLEIKISFNDDYSDANVYIESSQTYYGELNSIPESHVLWLSTHLGYDVLKKGSIFRKKR